MEGSKACDAYGLMPGHEEQQSDAIQAYAQATMGKSIPKSRESPARVKCETWVRLPKEYWPAHFNDTGDPVVLLELALYGHPDSGGLWERHCAKALTDVGFPKFRTGRACFPQI